MPSLKIQLVAYEPNGSRLGILPTPLTAKHSDVMNDLGAGTITYLAAASQSEYLEELCEVAFEVWDGAGWVEPGGRLIRLGSSAALTDGTRTRDYTLPSYGLMLGKIRMFRTDAFNEEGVRPFAGVTVGSFLSTLIDESKGRGNVPGLVYNFDSTNDSAGVPWGDDMPPVSLKYGDDLLTLLRNLAADGLVDWRIVGRELKAFKAETLGVAKPITLKYGVDVLEAPRDIDSSELAARVGVAGDEGLISESAAASPGPWG